MKLFYAPRSPFALKVRICLAEIQATEIVDLVPVDPWTDERLREYNPLCKVPTLGLDDGTALYGSSVIVAYLNECAGGDLIPTGSSRWNALRRESMGDGLTEATIRRFVESIEPITARARGVIGRQEQAIEAVLDHLETSPAWIGVPRDIGHVAIAVALHYLMFRSPEIAWRTTRPEVAAWFDDFTRRRSFQDALGGAQVRAEQASWVSS